jgi:hypothetical protein
MDGEIIELAEETVAQALILHKTGVVPASHPPVGDAVTRIPAADALGLILPIATRKCFVAYIETAAARANIGTDPAA